MTQRIRKAQRYVCVIGDLVDSRHVKDRNRLQRTLKRTLSAARHESSGLSPWTLTLGDEFQCVYADARTLFVDLLKIAEGLQPVQARFAIGVGPLLTPINQEQALEMDGPGFYAARTAIEKLRAEGGLFRLAGEPDTPPSLDLANHALTLAGHILQQARSAQRLRVLRHRLDGHNQRAIAEILNTTPANISQHVRNGALNTITATMQWIQDWVLDSSPPT